MAIGTAQRMMARQLYLLFFSPDRGLELFFSGRNNDRAPARLLFFFRLYLERPNNGQTTVSFFSGRN